MGVIGSITDHLQLESPLSVQLRHRVIDLLRRVTAVEDRDSREASLELVELVLFVEEDGTLGQAQPDESEHQEHR